MPSFRHQPPDERAIAEQVLMRAFLDIRGGQTDAGVLAAILSGFDSPVSPRLVAELLAGRLAEATTRAVQGGWTPGDLAQVVRRQADERYVGALAELVRREGARHPAARVHAGWLDDLGRLGAARPFDLHTVDGLEDGLAVGAVLAMLPPIAQVLPPPGAVLPIEDVPVDPADAQRLAKVRALLAKAESTEFPEEAEALSAKAQELISRYALDRLVTTVHDHPGSVQIGVRRLWLDPPYLFAKAMLVDAVARANRCRTAVSESLGFATIIGAPGDLESCELLVTSLLVQASSAMLGLARSRDRASRTASFRRAFLLAYASRIGERLAAATQDAASSSSRRDALVPVLRRHAEQVDATFNTTFPTLRKRRTTFTNGDGWQAGRAAADQARLNPTQRLPERSAASGDAM